MYINQEPLYHVPDINRHVGLGGNEQNYLNMKTCLSKFYWLILAQTLAKLRPQAAEADGKGIKLAKESGKKKDGGCCWQSTRLVINLCDWFQLLDWAKIVIKVSLFFIFQNILVLLCFFCLNRQKTKTLRHLKHMLSCLCYSLPLLFDCRVSFIEFLSLSFYAEYSYR